jgi:hypothetical protein
MLGLYATLILSGSHHMKYGDLSSIVQLGVGLHVGTAVLQLYTELGIKPLEQKIARIRSLFLVENVAERPPEMLREELDQLESRYELFKIEFFQEYKWCVVLMTGVAFLLAIFLVMIAAWADVAIEGVWYWFPGAAIILSFIPAPATLILLWLIANSRLRPLKRDSENLERRAVKAVP